MSRFWANNPELYDEMAAKNLPEPYRERVESGKMEIRDVPEEIRQQAYEDGEQDYWESLVQ